MPRHVGAGKVRKMSMPNRNPNERPVGNGRSAVQVPPPASRAAACAALAAGLLLAACSGVEVQNRQPAQELAQQQARPPGSVYTGWRVFQDRCATCHGADATGSRGPDLLPRVREIGQRRFVSLVLLRYDWSLPSGEAKSEGAAREALIEQIVQRRQGAVEMPAWQGEPRVTAHIADLYAYLSARAEGTQGPGKPTR